ncbi:MAG: hypothetical protein NTV54_15220 [Ignavibacteriales bacterium]|nr:hypothetical protein [Ignavibacteriales bacterium]
MKSKMAYVLVFVGTLVLSEVIMMVLAMVKPEIFQKSATTVAPTPTAALSHKDSTHVEKVDSLMTPEAMVEKHDEANMQTLELAQKSDSVSLLLSKLKISEKRIADLESRIPGEIKKSQAGDSTSTKDRKMLVKMLESMSPENAARIIESFRDTDAREILMGIKSRQAGKILSAMNIDRASKLMR